MSTEPWLQQSSKFMQYGLICKELFEPAHLVYCLMTPLSMHPGAVDAMPSCYLSCCAELPVESYLGCSS